MHMPLTTLFHLLYHQFAWTYDAVSNIVSLGQWRAWAACGLPFVSGPRVLEVGHGPGHMLAALRERGFDATGLDLSPQMGRIARRRLASGDAPARLVRGHAQALPFADASFDGALATFPTAYITAPATVAALHRVLRPGGRLVVVPGAQLTGSGPAVRFIDWLYAITGQDGGAPGDAGTEDEFWTRALVGPGFSVRHHTVTLPASVVTIIVAERLSVS